MGFMHTYTLTFRLGFGMQKKTKIGTKGNRIPFLKIVFFCYDLAAI